MSVIEGATITTYYHHDGWEGAQDTTVTETEVSVTPTDEEGRDNGQGLWRMAEELAARGYEDGDAQAIYDKLVEDAVKHRGFAAGSDDGNMNSRRFGGRDLDLIHGVDKFTVKLKPPAARTNGGPSGEGGAPQNGASPKGAPTGFKGQGATAYQNTVAAHANDKAYIQGLNAYLLSTAFDRQSEEVQAALVDAYAKAADDAGKLARLNSLNPALLASKLPAEVKAGILQNFHNHAGDKEWCAKYAQLVTSPAFLAQSADPAAQKAIVERYVTDAKFAKEIDALMVNERLDHPEKARALHYVGRLLLSDRCPKDAGRLLVATRCLLVIAGQKDFHQLESGRQDALFDNFLKEPDNVSSTRRLCRGLIAELRRQPENAAGGSAAFWEKNKGYADERYPVARAAATTPAAPGAQPTNGAAPAGPATPTSGAQSAPAPASSYSESDAKEAATTIREATKDYIGFDGATDEDAVYKVLKDRTAAEIDMIRKAYNKKYDDGKGDFDKDLHEDFKDDKTELDRLNALLKGKENKEEGRIDAKAAEIQAELDDAAVDEQAVLRMFEETPPEDRQAVAEAFAKKYGQSQTGEAAIDYLLSRCEESFEGEEMERARDLLKPENGDFARGAARADAGKLRVAMEGPGGTDEDTVFEVLSGKTPEQIQAIKDAYFEKYDEKLETRLEKEELEPGEWAYASKLLEPLPPDADDAAKAKWQAELSAARLYYAMDGAGTKKDIIKAELEGKSPQQIKAIIDAYHYESEKYPGGLRERLIDDLELAEEQEILHLLDVANITDEAALEKWQNEYDAKRLHVAMSGGTDEDLIRQVLAGKSKVQIQGDETNEGIAGAYKRLYGEDLRDKLLPKDGWKSAFTGELDGRDALEIRQIYDGGAIDFSDPEAAITEQIRRQRELSEYERQGYSWKDGAKSLIPGVGIYYTFKNLGSDEARGAWQKISHGDMDYETDRERLDRNLGDAQKALDEYKATGDPAKLAEAGRLAGFAESDVKTLVENKNAMTNAVVTTAVVVVGTVATLPAGGWGGVALAAGASAGTAAVGYTAMNSQVGAGEIARQTFIAGAAGGTGALSVVGKSGAAAAKGAAGAEAVGASRTTALAAGRSAPALESGSAAAGKTAGKEVALRSGREGAVDVAKGSSPRVIEGTFVETGARAGATAARTGTPLGRQFLTGAKLGAINDGGMAAADVATDDRAWSNPGAAALSILTSVVSGAALGMFMLGGMLGVGRLIGSGRKASSAKPPVRAETTAQKSAPERKTIAAKPNHEGTLVTSREPLVDPNGPKPLVRDSHDGVWKKTEDIVGEPSTTPSNFPRGRTIDGKVVGVRDSAASPKAIESLDKVVTTRLDDDYVRAVSNFKTTPQSQVIDFYVTGFRNAGRPEKVDFIKLLDEYAVSNPYRLTRSEIDAIYGYTTKLFYRELNKVLNAGGNADANALGELIESGVAKMQFAGDVQYRGIRLDSAAKIKEFDDAFKPGKTVTSDSFWSAGPTAANSYGDKSARELVIITRSARDITDLAFGVHFHDVIGKTPYSAETIIPPGITFKVLAIDSKGRVILQEQ